MPMCIATRYGSGLLLVQISRYRLGLTLVVGLRVSGIGPQLLSTPTVVPNDHEGVLLREERGKDAKSRWLVHGFSGGIAVLPDGAVHHVRPDHEAQVHVLEVGQAPRHVALTAREEHVEVHIGAHGSDLVSVVRVDP